jgi:diadenosine tetraphosphate (Ap4A) HIT family hydrolase
MDFDERGGDCVLCRRPVDWPVVHESEFWLTVVNRNQNLLGKTFIALRSHEEDVVALTPREWAALHEEVRWVTERVAQAFAPDHFNYSFLMNLDRHVHLHVIPRYLGARELAGVTFEDADYPDAYSPTPVSELASQALISAVAEALNSPGQFPPLRAV